MSLPKVIPVFSKVFFRLRILSIDYFVILLNQNFFLKQIRKILDFYYIVSDEVNGSHKTE